MKQLFELLTDRYRASLKLLSPDKYSEDRRSQTCYPVYNLNVGSGNDPLTKNTALTTCHREIGATKRREPSRQYCSNEESPDCSNEESPAECRDFLIVEFGQAASREGEWA